MSLDFKAEKKMLEDVVGTYVTSDSPQDRTIKTLAVRTFEPFMTRPGRALELGCCDGFMTSLIANRVPDVTVVDGSQTFIDAAKSRVPGHVRFVTALFEEYKTEDRYDYIFATYILEHVMDPVGLLKIAKDLLAPHGKIFVVVPNGRAFSRQLARHMGLVEDLFALTANDHAHGHRRVYDRASLNKDIGDAGLVQASQGGLMFKLLADFQMDKMMDAGILGQQQMDGLYQMGLDYPEMAGSLFSICQVP